MSDLLDTLRSFAQNGLSWATVISVLLFLSKQREGRIRSQERAEMRQDIKAIKAKLGVEEWSNGQASGSNNMDLRSLKRLFFSLQMALSLVRQKRRRLTMQNINWITLIPALLGALKLIMQPFGIEISDQNINEIANGAAAVVTIVGVIMSHTKGGAANASAAPTSVIPTK